MTRLRAATLLLIVQLVLVSSVAAKYLYERRTCPRVWAPSAQYDPNLPLRGRYLALQVLVDACHLPHDSAHYQRFMPYGVRPSVRTTGHWTWYVSLGVEDGHLVPVLQDHPKNPSDTMQLTLSDDRPCDRVPLSPSSEFFIPDNASSPFPLKPGHELWVEVTVPPSGPPRPIQLALSSKSGFQPLTF
ncbi:MAG TPA: hypothetical protein VHT28_10890 [Silvibacterium sp.]|jgi:hypothetical protein|nr:hypothetical protein [Silvibacterium sp.]